MTLAALFPHGIGELFNWKGVAGNTLPVEEFTDSVGEQRGEGHAFSFAGLRPG